MLLRHLAAAFLLLCAGFAYPGRDSATMVVADKLLAEKSYKLALEQYSAFITQNPSAREAREARYKAALCQMELRQFNEAKPLLKKILEENDNDVWAGRAHWLLEPALGRAGGIRDPETSPLVNLRKADEILSREKPKDLAEFYEDVVDTGISRYYADNKPDRAYLYGFFDRLLPLLKDDDAIARIHLLRLNRAGWLDGNAREEDRQAGLRQIVSEFPKTPAARQAQMAVAEYYMQRADLVSALKEYRVAADRWPDSQEGKQAARTAEDIKAEQVAFSLPEAYLPSDPIQFELRTRNVSKVTITATSFNPTMMLREQRQEQFDLEKVSGRPAYSKEIETKKRADYHATTASIDLDFHEPGAYVLKAEADSASCVVMLLISDLMLVGSNGSKQYEMWAVDAKTGKPRPGVRITVASKMDTIKALFGKDRREFTTFEERASDENGFAQTSAERLDPFVVTASDGKHYALLGSHHWNRRQANAAGTAYTYTDRSVYRPMQKVSWRSVVRYRNEGSWENLKEQRYDIEIRDPRGQSLSRLEDQKPNEYGALSGELTLTETALLGRYTITVRSRNDRYLQGQGDFRVEEYKKPEFEVNVAAAEKLYRIGSSVKAAVEAKYYFGAPVTDAEVKYTVRRRPHWTPWWQYWRGDGDKDLGWFDQAAQERGPRHGSQGDIVADGTGHTGSDGKFVIEFKAVTPPQQQIRMWESYPWNPQTNSFDFQIEVTVTDKSRRNIDGNQTIVVSDRALQLTARTQNHIYSPGDAVKVRLGSRNLNDEPVTATGTLYVEHVVWDETARKENVTTLTTTQVKIGDDGKLEETWRAPKDAPGQMRLVFIADDPFGGQSLGIGQFTVADETTKDLMHKYQGVEIVVDKDRYEVGDTARVIILCEHRDAYAWYWIDSGSGNLEKKMLPLKDRTTFLQVPITEGFVPNSQINVVVVRDKRVFSNSKEVIVPPLRKIINVKLVPGKESFRPGEEGEIGIEATDYQGKPVKTEFSLSMFDKSVLYIAPDTRVDIRRVFYGERRHVDLSVRNSAGEASQYRKLSPSEAGNLLYRWSFDADSEGRLVGKEKSTFYDRGDALHMRTLSDGEIARKMRAPRAAAPARGRALGAALTLEPRNSAAAGYYLVAYDGEDKADSGAAGVPEAVAQVRSDFRDSMFWSPSVTTNEQGKATVRVKFPDSLTTWRAVAVGADTTNLVGNDSTETLVKKNILVRLEAPRFFRERDRVTLSGVVHNYLKTDKNVRVKLALRGLDLTASATTETRITVKPDGDMRVDWEVDAKRWGEAVIRMDALTDEESDAAEMKFPVLAHGIDKFVAWNGTSEDIATTSAKIEKSGDMTKILQQVDVPAERIKASTKLTVLVNPSLASAIKDSLPYLIDYPYGCVEQTMSRFLPAVVAQRLFNDLGIPRDEAMERKLEDVVEKGLERLMDFQQPHGGWGWWRGDTANSYMTAHVMFGLTLGRQAGAAINDNCFGQGLDCMKKSVREFEPKKENMYYWRHNDLHALAYQLFVLSLSSFRDDKALDYVWKNRDELTPQTLAMLARTLWRCDRMDDAQTVLRNLYNFAVSVPENGTMHWGKTERAWYWWDDGVESTAHGLMAYLEIDPQNEVIPKAMKWLVLNRQGNRWKSSKDTGMAVLALAQYMKQRREELTEMTVSVGVAGLPPKEFKVEKENFWKFDGQAVFDGDAVPDGSFPVTITKTGSGTLFYSVQAEYFTLEEGIKKAGNEIFVERVYEKLIRDQVKPGTAGAPVGMTAVDRYEPIHDGDTVKSGDELRVTLKIKSLNDYEYLVFEDPKPAGMEPVALQSGTTYGDGLCSNMELRDQYVAFFVTHMGQGEHTIKYSCRAEIPGSFHTMPTKGYAMYFPPLRTNSDELRVTVVDK